MPRKEGFRSIRSSSGSAFGVACEEPTAATGKEPRRCTGLSVEARSLAEVGSAAAVRLLSRDWNSNLPPLCLAAWVAVIAGSGDAQPLSLDAPPGLDTA